MLSLLAESGLDTVDEVALAANYPYKLVVHVVYDEVNRAMFRLPNGRMLNHSCFLSYYTSYDWLVRPCTFGRYMTFLPVRYWTPNIIGPPTRWNVVHYMFDENGNAFSKFDLGPLELVELTMRVNPYEVFKERSSKLVPLSDRKERWKYVTNAAEPENIGSNQYQGRTDIIPARSVRCRFL